MSLLPGWNRDNIYIYTADVLKVVLGLSPIENHFKQGPDFITTDRKSNGLLVSGEHYNFLRKCSYLFGFNLYNLGGGKEHDKEDSEVVPISASRKVMLPLEAVAFSLQRETGS